jgi:hypothetical protein
MIKSVELGVCLCRYSYLLDKSVAMNSWLLYLRRAPALCGVCTALSADVGDEED